MKKIGLFCIAVLLIIIFCLHGSLAQDWTQWHLPEGASARLGKGSLNDVKFSPDGALLAVATHIGAWLYDVDSGTEMALLNEERRNVRTVAFSPDGKTLATGGWSREGAIQLWDIDTATQVSIMGKGIGVSVLAFSEDGKTLASVGWQGAPVFYVWDVETEREVSHFVGEQDSINSGTLAVSSNHRFVASASGNKVFLWDAVTQTLKRTIEDDEDFAGRLAFSPDNKTLVIGHTTLRLWDVETGSQMSRLDGHTRAVRALTFSRDGKTLASGDSSGDIRLWNIAAGGDQLTLPRLLGGIAGKRLSGSRLFTEHKRPIEALDFSPDGRTLVSASRDNTIRVWDVDAGTSHLMTKGHTEGIKALGFLEDGETLASGSFDTTLRLWHTGTKNEQLIPVKHRWFAFGFGFSRDGKTVAIGSVGDDVRLWSRGTEDFIATFRTAHKGFIDELIFSPNGKILASGSRGGTIELWDVSDRQRIAKLQGHRDEINALTFAPDGKTLASTAKGERIIILWDVINIGRKTALLAERTTEAGALAFAPDGKTVVSGHRDGNLYSWDVATGEQLSIFTGYAGRVTALAFSADGAMLANGSSDGAVRLWDTSSNTLRRDPLIGHVGAVTELTFSPDSGTLFSGGFDGTILVWDLENGARKNR